MPSFIPALGSTLHLVGVCVNRIGKDHFSEAYCLLGDGIRLAANEFFLKGLLRSGRQSV
jgi:hypothetical protein